MKILITGSMGFIGSNLVPFLNEKHELIMLDQYISDLENYYRVDVSIYSELSNIFDLHHFDLVIHMAAECGIENCEEHVQKSIETNIIGTYNIINLCKKYNVKLIYFSTSEIYGNLNNQKMSEDVPITLLQPRNHYALQKLFGEKMVMKELDNYIIIRPFMVYGLGENLNKYRSVISKFIKISKENGVLEVHRDSFRSWLHIKDFIKAVDILIDKNTTGIYNIGNDTEILSIEELGKIIIENIGSGSINIIDIPSVRTAYKIGDFNKLSNLGFIPDISIQDGINQMIKSLK